MVEMGEARARQQVTAKMFASKYRSKREVYNFLTVECRAYLAPYECHTIYFLKQLVQGERKFIHCDRVRYLSVPQYEGLGIKEFIEEALRHPQTRQYLPDEEDFRRLPRQWIINLAYTLVDKPFADWAHERIQARNQKLIDEQDLAIDIDPDILRCFQASTNISTMKGSGAYLLKSGSKRRRKQADIRGQNSEQEMADLEASEHQQKISQLEEELSRVQQERDNNRAAAQILTNMIENGDAEMDASGSVKVSKRKSSSANIIGNLDDVGF